ncbi:MAG: type II toxin-antitoxin system PemK/MazF family toxin [Blastocatellia bacterium]|nr:type II toxin-antitoxin system PemK/MazF family toxin [Blastocatellia bacterium]
MTRGKIVLTPFPFTDLTGSKLRPALIVSSSARTGADVILAFISSVFDPSRLASTDEFLLDTDADFPASGLKVSSVFKMDKLATVKRTIIRGELGEASAGLQSRLDEKLKAALGAFICSFHSATDPPHQDARFKTIFPLLTTISRS